jgi:hypothetical protein
VDVALSNLAAGSHEVKTTHAAEVPAVVHALFGHLTAALVGVFCDPLCGAFGIRSRLSNLLLRLEIEYPVSLLLQRERNVEMDPYPRSLHIPMLIGERWRVKELS